MATLPIVYDAARAELTEILDAGARALKSPGIALMPIKREMLGWLSAGHTDLIMDACNLLFAAILAYEAGLWDMEQANNPIELVSARLETGKAEGVVNALFHGATAPLLLTAMDRAPIAFYAMTEASPALNIIDRCIKAERSR